MSTSKVIHSRQEADTSLNIGRLGEPDSTLPTADFEAKTSSTTQLSPEEIEEMRQKRMKYAFQPVGMAIPRESGLAKVGLMQPLPGVSYLATSPTYYEMMARNARTKRTNVANTRRMMTENRI